MCARKPLKAEALSNIDGPSVDLTAFRGRLSTDLNIDTSGLSGVVGGIESVLPSIPGLPKPQIPNSLSREVVTDLTSFGLLGMWPIYTGGRLGRRQGACIEPDPGRAGRAHGSGRAAGHPGGAALFPIAAGQARGGRAGRSDGRRDAAPARRGPAGKGRSDFARGTLARRCGPGRRPQRRGAGAQR